MMNVNYKLYRIWARLSSFPEKQPIFILGNQKTGTSAIAALLGEAIDESYCIDVFCHLGDLQQKLFDKKITFKQFVNRSRDFFAKKIIKEPSFTFFYPELKNLFPQAKFLLIIRNPFENVRSICNRLNIDGHTTMSWRDFNFEGLHDDWKYILKGEEYGHGGDTIIETLAKRVSLCYKIFEENSDTILLVKYEDFISNKVGFINSLASELGKDVTKKIDNKVNVQFQPKGKKVDPKKFFSSENYNIITSECQLLINKHYKVNI